MISLTSPVRTRAHDWPAGAKLAALCAATVLLFKAQSLWVHGAAFVTMLALYRLPGEVFFRAGLRALKVLWPFVLILALYHLVVDGHSGRAGHAGHHDDAIVGPDRGGALAGHTTARTGAENHLS